MEKSEPTELLPERRLERDNGGDVKDERLLGVRLLEERLVVFFLPSFGDELSPLDEPDSDDQPCRDSVFPLKGFDVNRLREPSSGCIDEELSIAWIPKERKYKTQSEIIWLRK